MSTYYDLTRLVEGFGDPSINISFGDSKYVADSMPLFMHMLPGGMAMERESDLYPSWVGVMR